MDCRITNYYWFSCEMSQQVHSWRRSQHAERPPAASHPWRHRVRLVPSFDFHNNETQMHWHYKSGSTIIKKIWDKKTQTFINFLYIINVCYYINLIESWNVMAFKINKKMVCYYKSAFYFLLLPFEQISLQSSNANWLLKAIQWEKGLFVAIIINCRIF